MLPDVVEDDSRYVGNDLLSLSHPISGIGDKYSNRISLLVWQKYVASVIHTDYASMAVAVAGTGLMSDNGIGG